MYHLNPAVIKSMLSSMSAAQLARHMVYIRSQVEQLPIGNRRSMFVRLYQFCISLSVR